MKRLAVIVLFFLAACPKPDNETTPCENHGKVQAIISHNAATLSFGYRCQDGHEEFWENGEKTVG